MKKSFYAAFVLALVLFVPSVMSAQDDVDVSLDSAQIAYLQTIDDPRDVDSLTTGYMGPMYRKVTHIEYQNLEDTTKTDTISITEGIYRLHGLCVTAGISFGGIADGMTYYNKSIGDHFSMRPSVFFGFEGRQMGFGNTALSNRVNFGVYGQIYMTRYSPKSTSAGKMYLSGAIETYLGYDIFGMKDGIHVLSIGPTFGLEMQRMDSILDRTTSSFVVDQAWNVNFGLRVHYNVILSETGTYFSVIGGIRASQVKAVNQTDWTLQIYASVGIGQLMQHRVAKKELAARNKKILDTLEELQPKDDQPQDQAQGQ
jgi:hypothetical protein